ncbi:hypothetical protein JZ751_006579 [Albula glossodonta]|uniref:Uncharacterized protein n=1 Tax=Albula glossodonta TaxID=121402 RepID=A0A8T2NAM6_9TELE|nr:hypothetical protein JZ751_006579 [Albula glossodonta]
MTVSYDIIPYEGGEEAARVSAGLCLNLNHAIHFSDLFIFFIGCSSSSSSSSSSSVPPARLRAASLQLWAGRRTGWLSVSLALGVATVTVVCWQMASTSRSNTWETLWFKTELASRNRNPAAYCARRGSSNCVMEDTIEVILQDRDREFLRPQTSPTLAGLAGALLASLYGLWTMFALPGFRRVPIRLKVPYLPSSVAQTTNVMKLLEGREGPLADLGSGDGRLVLAACSMGMQCTGFEINSLLLAYSRCRALWRGVAPSQAQFINSDFWKTDLSRYRNVTVFLAPGVGSGLDQVWAYDITGDLTTTHTPAPPTRCPPAANQSQQILHH